VDARVIVDSPADFKQLKREQPIRLTPTWKQFLDIVKHLRGYNLSYQIGGTTVVMELEHDDSADLIEFMGKAGVGTAECANLRGEHIDFKANRITLYRSKTDTGYTIPLFPQVASLLGRLKKEGKLVQGKPVFTVRNPKKALAHACRRLNFPHFTPRSLRRCFITRAIEKGVDFKTLAAWQGHRDGGVLIAWTYSHLRSEHSDRMAKKLA
jgi:integrase